MCLVQGYYKRNEREVNKMTVITEKHIIAHVVDIDRYQVHMIEDFLNTKGLQCGYDWDRNSQDGTPLYSLTADVTGHSLEFYGFLDSISK
jgi:hypothetical protein